MPIGVPNQLHQPRGSFDAKMIDTIDIALSSLDEDRIPQLGNLVYSKFWTVPSGASERSVVDHMSELVIPGYVYPAQCDLRYGCRFAVRGVSQPDSLAASGSWYRPPRCSSPRQVGSVLNIVS